ncbi:PAAR domain-containing protein [Pseudomonas indica]|uniref:Zn-binding Pro-Ala-Ala-Arg (PAAR) domain-containing protein, incolved in TypeVI secretion n=1 Tax=Pseudomonas indica TaxID=137658 RepID=A0A1G9L1D0_9PSED|nr:PAAR domain-containing protein [Pseudomonas indica]SDL55563.1 Zn-binding Pro-Ala-Ala-Arg (PAAR) domain-containing protein, incolved in TypeVI secretion [Pseudomonas indica]
MISAARLGDMHVCPIPGHGSSPIVSASSDTQINFLGAARVGDVCGCGAVITTGFPSIIVDHRPLAHLGSPTSHGGRIVSGSPDTFGGFTFGEAVPRTVVDFAKLGAVRPDGSVDDRLMAELLADPHLEQRALLSGALVQPSSPPATTAREPLTPELIAVAGSQHDNSSGNKMMFIGQAVRELAEFKRNRPALARTLVLFTPSYNDAMLNAARDSAKAYGAALVEVTSAQALIDYLNQGRDRKRSPIEHLSLFSHGVPQRVAFGYQLTEDFQMSLDALNYNAISPLAFSSSARIDSYACRTGMGNRSEFPIEDGIQFFPQTNDSLAQRLADHLQIKVGAFIRRSDYKNTWGSFEERRMGNLCGFSGDAAPGEEWCRKWKVLSKERADSDRLYKFTYQTMGAINPVISGDTPLGVPGGHFEFLPQ